MSQPTTSPASHSDRAPARPGLMSRAYAIKQAMYGGDRPGRSARVINRLTALQHAAGLAPRRAVTLEVIGRRSGRFISFPLVVADHDGERYLVAMLGERTNWVQNVRAAGGHATIRRRGRVPVRLEEVPPTQRAPILRRYLYLAPGARPHIPVDPRAGLNDFAQVANRFPVFRISSVTSSPPVKPEAPLELTARMRVRPGQLDGFRAQAAECVRLAREQDTATLRYDWFLTADGTACEVREAYRHARGLVEHRAHVAAALATLFERYADGHHITVYGPPTPELRELAESAHIGEHVTWMTFLDGLDPDGFPSRPGSAGHDPLRAARS